MLTKLVPLELENGAILYIEAQDEVETGHLTPIAPPNDTGEPRRGGAKGIGNNLPVPFRATSAQSMEILQSTLRTYTLYCLNAFKNFGTANVDEVTLEFGVNLSADAGIPYIVSGKAQSNLKVTVKCSYKQGEPSSTSLGTSFSDRPIGEGVGAE